MCKDRATVDDDDNSGAVDAMLTDDNKYCGELATWISVL